MKNLIVVSLIILACACGKKPHRPQERRDLQGYATYFDKMGSLYGACGLSDETIGTQNYVALNVQKTPFDYDSYLARPITDVSKLGLYANGRNCGRWIRVTLGKNCFGDAMDGKPFEEFCSRGVFKQTTYTGASLELIVADSCQDNNSFCRDDYGHLDIHTEALGNFSLNGLKINPLNIGWNNPRVTWHFIKAPNYTGDIRISFVRKASTLWPTFVISNLENGIGLIEVRTTEGTWLEVPRQGDNGLIFNLPTNTPRPYEIRAFDAEGLAINKGKIYKFDFPCTKECLEETPTSFF